MKSRGRAAFFLRGETMEPTAATREEARRTPNGWVYAIDGDFGSDTAVPPQAIKGAWKVDANGEIVGDFVPNPQLPTA